MNASRTFAVGAAVIGVLVLALVATFTFRDQAQVAASPSPTASPTPSPSATPSATATASPSVAASATPTSPATTGRYVSPLGYLIETPPPWHLSTCIENVQGIERDGEHFVPVPARDETASDLGPQYPTLTVLSAANPDNLTPRQWIAQRKEPIVFTDAGEPLEDVTYAGRPAVRKGIREAPGVYHHMVTSGGRMYFVTPEIRRPLDASLSSSLVRMIGSLQFISDAERAAARAALPPAPPPRTPEQVADGLAAAFRANDINALIALSAPCMFRFGEQAGGTNWSKEKYFEDLRAMFAAGLTVTVQPRPITTEGDNRWVASMWQDSRGSQTRRMILRRGPNENWRWAGTIERYQ